MLKSKFDWLTEIGHAVARPLLRIGISSQQISGRAEQPHSGFTDTLSSMLER